MGSDIWEKWVSERKTKKDALTSISEKTISSSEMSCESKMSSMSANAVLYSVTPKQNKR